MKCLAALILIFCLCLILVSPTDGQDPEAELKKFSTTRLLDCLYFKAQCSGRDYDWEFELARRRPINTLIHRFNNAPFNGDGGLFRDSVQRTLYLISEDGDDPRIDHLMRRELDDGTWDGEYYTALYLAKKGVPRALSILKDNCWKYSISSAEWAVALSEFGRQHYRPAIPCLIESAHAASLNAADAAYQSLLLFYPDAPRNLPSPEAAQEYFRKRYLRERKNLHATNPG
jgi:hypothetical protein